MLCVNGNDAVEGLGDSVMPKDRVCRGVFRLCLSKSFLSDLPLECTRIIGIAPMTAVRMLSIITGIAAMMVSMISGKAPIKEVIKPAKKSQ